MGTELVEFCRYVFFCDIATVTRVAILLFIRILQQTLFNPSVMGCVAIAASVVHFFSERHNQEILRRLEKAGLSMTGSAARKGGPLAGKTFVLTGTLPGLTREEARALIEEHGGKVASGVSKNVQYVVAGEDAGSKLERARALHIPVLTEAELHTMIGQ